MPDYEIKNRAKFDLVEYQKIRNGPGCARLIHNHGSELFQYMLDFFEMDKNIEANPDLPSYAMAVMGNAMTTMAALMRETFPDRTTFNKALEDLFSTIFKEVQGAPDAATLEQMYGHEDWANER
jgi:hypothetical protein